MKLYIATYYGRREEAQDLAATLRGAGHQVTATWLDGEPEPNEEALDATSEAARQVEWADRDLFDIMNSDGLVLMTRHRDETSRECGCHFEAGYAHASSMPLWVLGPAPTCFYHKFPLCPNEDVLLKYIAEYEEAKKEEQQAHVVRMTKVAEDGKKKKADMMAFLNRNRVMD